MRSFGYAIIGILAFTIAPSPPTRRVDGGSGGTVADCRFATLQADLRAGGSWVYAPNQCAAPIVFPTTITIAKDAALTAQGRDIRISGAGGAIAYDGGTMTISNSTLSANRTGAGGAGVPDCGMDPWTDRGNGGALDIGDNDQDTVGKMSVINCTLAGNTTGVAGIGASNGEGGNGGAIAAVDGAVTLGNNVTQADIPNEIGGDYGGDSQGNQTYLKGKYGDQGATWSVWGSRGSGKSWPPAPAVCPYWRAMAVPPRPLPWLRAAPPSGPVGERSAEKARSMG